MDIAKKISPFSVKVIWGKEEVGSGLLVRSINNTYYLFTVRHLFKKGKDDNYRDVTKSFIKEELKNISIAKKSFENNKHLSKLKKIKFINSPKLLTLRDLEYHRIEFCKKSNIFVDDFLFFEDTDLLIFSLKDKKIPNLPIIKVLEGNHQEETYYFYGYPNGSKDSKKNTTGTIEKGEYSQPSEEEKNFFRLSATKNIDGDAVSGYSGSGVFRKKDKNIYLVGLFSRAKEELSYYECVDLVAIIGDINQKLKEKFDDEIEVGEFGLEEEQKDKSKTSNIDSNAKKYMIIFIICVSGILGYIFLNKNDKINTSTEISKKIDLKGRVVNCTKGIPDVSIYVEDSSEKKTETNGSGYFIIKSVSVNKDVIRLCYENNKVFEGIQCRKYQGDTNVSFCK